MLFRSRLWKRELQNFADENNISITVSHYPPGTSKWNKIEHRLFCHITQNWRGKPLTSRLAVIELIASTTTTTGLTVRCELDTRSYAKAIKISDDEFGSLNIQWSEFHPDWNYTIHPRKTEVATSDCTSLVQRHPRCHLGQAGCVKVMNLKCPVSPFAMEDSFRQSRICRWIRAILSACCRESVSTSVPGICDQIQDWGNLNEACARCGAKAGSR